ncbi:GNAT family N-acetyltransferase [Rhizobium sp. 1399]|jgi:GNAT superfamily N-acetyltransferase|uniref:GNAT family N-acetyltransferase n=1 Tax=Rhizobium sp. 1399 TaxID=2817758 RepID=UPI00285D69B7|nr:GNAT family N-acetyltransferase [Rhizobium sp. 1399]MDR6669758.1 GNAT superfamily N-acetyltransferase [Rhizobium sp. 1399]
MRLLENETRAFEWSRDGYTVSTDRDRLDMDMIGRFLAEEAYWSPGVSRDLVEKAIAGSMPFGLYGPDGAQAGFARVVTDGSLFAYLRDVFVLSAHRGKGLGKWLAESAINHPDLATVKGWMLATSDAHELYAKLGFHALKQPDKYMQIIR